MLVCHTTFTESLFLFKLRRVVSLDACNLFIGSHIYIISVFKVILYLYKALTVLPTSSLFMYILLLLLVVQLCTQCRNTGSPIIINCK